VLTTPLWAVTLTISLAAVTPAPPTRMVLKDGTVYFLKEPPRYGAGRIIFTTTDGKAYSLNESEVDTIGASAPTPVPRVTYSPMDSKSLGAIARQQREKKGLSSPMAPEKATPARRARRSAPKPTRTARPAPSRTPSPAADKASHG
jgi:hypothetical protein